ncbi:MAG: hypothetical protein IV107_03895 [Paucibacter sp.]|nr:hypothetical protein [Roseateles sp.]
MTTPTTLDRALLHDLELVLECMKAARMPDRAKKAATTVIRAHMDRLKAPAMLAAVAPGRWTLSQGDQTLELDFASGRRTRLEAAARFAASMLLPPGIHPQYTGPEWMGQDLPCCIFEHDVGVNALRNARNELAVYIERAGWPQVGAELRRMTIGRDGHLKFKPSGAVVVFHPCAGRVQD